MKEFSYKKYGVNYERVGAISCLYVFGLNIYNRIDNHTEIFDGLFR